MSRFPRIIQMIVRIMCDSCATTICPWASVRLPGPCSSCRPCSESVRSEASVAQAEPRSSCRWSFFQTPTGTVGRDPLVANEPVAHDVMIAALAFSMLWVLIPIEAKPAVAGVWQARFEFVSHDPVPPGISLCAGGAVAPSCAWPTDRASLSQSTQAG